MEELELQNGLLVPAENRGFSFGDFFEQIGSTVQSGVSTIGSNFDANAANAMTIATLNAAKAAAIVENERTKNLAVKYLFAILVIIVLAVVGVSIFKAFKK